MSKCSEKSAAVEKGHQGKVFEAEAEKCSEMPFFYQGRFFEHEDTFFPPRQKNYVNRVLFFFLQDFGRVYRL